MYPVAHFGHPFELQCIATEKKVSDIWRGRGGGKQFVQFSFFFFFPVPVPDSQEKNLFYQFSFFSSSSSSRVWMS